MILAFWQEVQDRHLRVTSAAKLCQTNLADRSLLEALIPG